MDRIINDINAFLDGYDPSMLRAALKVRNLHLRGERIEGGWKKWTGEGVPPRPYEWRGLPNGSIQYRESIAGAPLNMQATPTGGGSTASQGKTDTSLRHNPSVSCPWCGAETFLEPLCPACRAGKAGMSARVICGENSDHIFYIPRKES